MTLVDRAPPMLPRRSNYPVSGYRRLWGAFLLFFVVALFITSLVGFVDMLRGAP